MLNLEEHLGELLGRHTELLWLTVRCGSIDSRGQLLRLTDRPGQALIELSLELQNRLDLVPLLDQVGRLVHIRLGLSNLGILLGLVCWFILYLLLYLLFLLHLLLLLLLKQLGCLERCDFLQLLVGSGVYGGAIEA